MSQALEEWAFPTESIADYTGENDHDPRQDEQPIEHVRCDKTEELPF